MSHRVINFKCQQMEYVKFSMESGLSSPSSSVSSGVLASPRKQALLISSLPVMVSQLRHSLNIHCLKGNVTYGTIQMGDLRAKGILTQKKDSTGASGTGGYGEPIALFNLHTHPVR